MFQCSNTIAPWILFLEILHPGHNLFHRVVEVQQCLFIRPLILAVLSQSMSGSRGPVFVFICALAVFF